MLIGVHIPKTGGTSLRYTLSEHFNKSLHLIYGEKPMNDAPEIRHQKLHELNKIGLHTDYEGVDCIYGHFLPCRFNLLAQKRKITFFTWLRHPVERCISEYYHVINNAEFFSDRIFYKKVIDENWDLQQFITSEFMRNYYTQYLWSFPLKSFSFIGIMDFYENDFNEFCGQYLGRSYAFNHLNKGSFDDYKKQLDPSFWRKAETFHQKDMDLYGQALEWRDKKFNQIK